MLRYSLLPTITASYCLFLTACQPEKPQETALQCNHPAVAERIRDDLQQSLKDQARQFAAQDQRQFVDADKVIATAAEINVILNGAEQQNDNGTAYCQGEISINIPENTLAVSATNSPLLYGDNPLNQLIRQNLSGDELRYNDNGVFDQNLQYIPQTADDGTVSLNYRGNGLNAAHNALLTALLPYGIKDMLQINGQTVSREQALSARLESAVETVENLEEPNEVFASTENASQEAMEILTPSEKNAPTITLGAEEIEYARADNRDADQDINTLWKQLDSTVQQELLSEQRDWIADKNENCRQAATQADSNLQAEYRYLQCDTRMTRERIQYLRGYSLP